MPPPGTSADRLGRLLNLVPYLQSRPGIRVAEAAGDLGVTERQLREDLELLWVCGLPGYGPGDLIDMAFDGDRVTITYDAGIDRPLRLTPDEALALVVALRMLAETPGMGDRDAIERALAKIESAAGDLAHSPVAVRLPGNADRLDTIRGVVERRRALHITYYAATRDETTERVVDPMRVLLADGRAYLEAWCRRAEAVRARRDRAAQVELPLDALARCGAHLVAEAVPEDRVVPLVEPVVREIEPAPRRRARVLEHDAGRSERSRARGVQLVAEPAHRERTGRNRMVTDCFQEPD